MKFFKKRDEVEDLLEIIYGMAKEEGISLSSYISRLLPDKVVKTGVDAYGEYILDQYACPNCKRPVGDEVLVFNYCPGCGKALSR